jgi:hypothetical protein
MNNWYVYRHIRLDKNEPFYIGIGCKQNYGRAKEKVKRSDFWKKIVAKSDYRVEVLMDNLSHTEAELKEIEFISIYGRVDKNNGSLCNLTNGGMGRAGFVVTEDFIEKTRESRRLGGINGSRTTIANGHISRLGTMQGRINTIDGIIHRAQKISSENRKRIIYQIDLNTNSVLAEFDSIKQASDTLNISKGNICMCCKGNRNNAGGYIFKYK